MIGAASDWQKLVVWYVKSIYFPYLGWMGSCFLLWTNLYMYRWYMD